MQDVAALSIVDNVNNHPFYKFLRDYYAEAAAGTKLYILPVPRTQTMSYQFTPGVNGKVPVEAITEVSNGEVSLVFTCYNPDNTITLTLDDGLDQDVWLTVTAAQAFCEGYIASKNTPLRVITEGFFFDGDHTALPDLNTMTNDRVQILIGNDESRTGLTAAKGAAIGAYAGRLATIGVSTNPGRKKDGPLLDAQVYIKSTSVENYDVTSLHDKNYVTFRTHNNSSGYYITDCPMATAKTDDYSKLTRGRVIDKAYKIAFTVLSEEILEDFSVTSSGTIDPIYAKSIEGKVINAIYTQMTLNRELSADNTNPLDKGCVVTVDITYPTASTSTIKLQTLAVRPRGYAEFIIVPLGFAPVNS
jgi:hypothetical protein